MLCGALCRTSASGDARRALACARMTHHLQAHAWWIPCVTAQSAVDGRLPWEAIVLGADVACASNMLCWTSCAFRLAFWVAQGPSAKEAKRDTTAFEAARAEWSKATLSAKGSVGATGDHRSEMWLGVISELLMKRRPSTRCSLLLPLAVHAACPL